MAYNKMILFGSALALIALVLVACGSATVTTPVSAPSATPVPTLAANTAPTKSSSPFATKRISGGSVDVDVTPTTINVGEPLVFDIAMNTHSVDLSDDLTKIAVLRDDAGKEYKPTTWEGAGPGGHHREGTLKFAGPGIKPKFLELVIRGMAGVPERVFHWDLS